MAMPYSSIKRDPPLVQIKHAAFHLFPDAVRKIAA